MFPAEQENKLIAYNTNDLDYEMLREYISLHDDNASGVGSFQDTLDSLAIMKESLGYLVRRTPIKTPSFDELIRQFDALTFKHKEAEETGGEKADDLPF